MSGARALVLAVLTLVAVAALVAGCGGESMTGTGLKPPDTTDAPVEATTTAAAPDTTDAPVEATTTAAAPHTTDAPVEATTTKATGISDEDGVAPDIPAPEEEVLSAGNVPPDEAPAGAGAVSGADTTEDPPLDGVAEPVTGAAADAVTVSDDVPDLAMTDLATGAAVQIRSLVTGETPLLLWFWSPY